MEDRKEKTSHSPETCETVCDCGHDHEHGHEHEHEHGHDHEHEHEHEHEHGCGCHGHEHEHDDCCHGHEHDHDDCCHGYEHEHGDCCHDDGCGCGHGHNHGHSHGRMVDCGCGHSHGNGDDGDEKRMLILGGAIYALGLGLWFFHGHDFLATAVLLLAYLALGLSVLKTAVTNIFHGEIFDECFLMSISTLGALALGEFPEAVAVMFFYRLGEFFEDMAVGRSERSIEALLDIRPDTATVQRDGEWVAVSPERVKIGERMLVKPGERIALDGVVLEGSSSLDTRALTGESAPRSTSVGDTALSGCVNGEGTLVLEVKNGYAESTASRIIDLVRSASENKAPSENFIRRFAKVYTPAVVVLALLLALLPPLLLGGGWTDWLRRSFVFLVISCPCALVISVPLTFLGGVGAASRRGVLVKGSNYLEALCTLETVVFDKTGTLTEGSFTVKGVYPANGVEEAELLRCAAAAEGHSTHPIARSILAYCGGSTVPVSEQVELSGRGVRVVLEGERILAGNGRLLEEHGVAFEPCPEAGTQVYVARGGRYLGCILIGDSVKKDSREALDALKKRGVKRTVMLTGDSEAIAGSVAGELGIDEYAAALLPEQKLDYMEKLMGRSGKLAYVGDGINDAPVLSRADVGIAMGALGSDAAIEAADVVLMTDEPGKLPEALDIARKTHRIVMENIVFALGVKFLFLLLGALGIAGMWMAVIGDVGVMVAAVLNAMRMMRH